jgi:hypothetical protein
MATRRNFGRHHTDDDGATIFRHACRMGLELVKAPNG